MMTIYLTIDSKIKATLEFNTDNMLTFTESVQTRTKKLIHQSLQHLNADSVEDCSFIERELYLAIAKWRDSQFLPTTKSLIEINQLQEDTEQEIAIDDRYQLIYTIGNETLAFQKIDINLVVL